MRGEQSYQNSAETEQQPASEREERRRATPHFSAGGGGGVFWCCGRVDSLREGRGALGVGSKVSKGKAKLGCVGQAVKDKGVKEGQHLDLELFPMQV